MIYVYTTRIDNAGPDTFDVLMKFLSPEDGAKAARFVHAADRNRLIAGRLALRFGLNDLGIGLTSAPTRLSFSAYGRPSLGHEIDFNIAHSGNIVVCAISRTEAVGIDIEEIRAIAYQDFTSCFSSPEWRTIEESDSLRTFYSFWTMKEAAIKANGKGLSIPLSDVHIIDSATVSVQSELWYVTSLGIDPRYVCHLAYKTASLNIQTITFDLTSFL